ncbi:MAG: hypothetical protein AAB480_02190 [Patescibacteria group bacterium]
MSKNVVDLKKRFAYFLELEMEVWFFVDTKAKDDRQKFLVGCFSTLAERTIWKRAFWRDLPHEAKQYCVIRQITCPLLESRRRKMDIDVRGYKGSATVVARQILRLARDKQRTKRSS